MFEFECRDLSNLQAPLSECDQCDQTATSNHKKLEAWKRSHCQGHDKFNYSLGGDPACDNVLS